MMQIIHTTVRKVVRRRNSAIGNPTFEFQTDAGTFRTAQNTSCAFVVENVFQLNTTLDQEMTLYLSGADRVYNWRF
jgi:hypothetical protein